jgi:ankyrin repeat protein
MQQPQQLLRPLSADYKRLFSYVQRGDAEAVKRELQSGTQVNVVDPVTTDSPLMLACRKGFTNIVKMCLDFGAKNDPHPDFGQTALHAAVASGHFSCAEIILNVAAESDADHIITNLTDQYGQTPLHCAALIGSVPLTELLLRHGAQISSVDSYGQTPLHLSAGSVNKACLAVLLDHGGDEVMEAADVYGNRPLHHAVYHGRLECAKLLLETAADVTARNSKNFTPYNLASMQGHHQIGLLLLEYRDHHNVPPSTTATPNNKLPFFTPSKGGPPTSYSPQQFDMGNTSTPPTSRYEEKEFRTPMTSNKYEIAVSINEPSLISFGPSSLSLGVPEFRRNQSNELVGLHLPRPHTVGSPSVNNKALSAKKKSSKASSAVSSPIESNRKNSESSLSDFNGSQQLFGSAIPQLSTPLFSRDISNK